MLFYWLIRPRIQILNTAININVSCIMCEEKNKPRLTQLAVLTKTSCAVNTLFPSLYQPIQATHTTCQNIFGECKMLKQQHNHPHYPDLCQYDYRPPNPQWELQLCHVTNKHQFLCALCAWFMTTVSLQSNGIQLHVHSNWIIFHLENRISQSGASWAQHRVQKFLDLISR